ncbi:MAG: nucleotidyltransferase domain-containing protein [Acidovorax sp.]|uniref:nucleotidyltransferase domain-containing protein n=1 Tax=Acidovorax sp. TaxID=1872122 RepID=UPI0039E222E4
MSNITQAISLLFPASRQQVLAALLLQPGRSLHLRELARLAGSHAGTLAREVDKLTQAGLLLRSDHGNQSHYSANLQHPLYADLAAIFRKTHGAVPALRTALEPLARQIDLAFVYGSMASGTHTEHSDVDVLLVGTADFVTVVQALYPLHEQLGREVNPVVWAPQELAAKAQAGDAFVRDVLRKPKLWIKGDDHELEQLAGHWPLAGAAA